MSPINSNVQQYESPQQKTSRYLLHFVGGKLYPATRFIAESRRIGVQRAMPFSMLRKSVKYGQPILVAKYQPKEEPCPSQACEGTGKILDDGGHEDGKQHTIECPVCIGKGKVKTPVAVVFGYFTVTGFSHDLPANANLKLASLLDIVSIENHTSGSGSGGVAEQRACGSYSIGATVYVNDDLDEIAGKIEEVCQELGLDPLKAAKYFVRGPLTVLPAPIVLEGCKFIRGYQWVDVESPDIVTSTPQRAVFTLYNYEKRAYLKKEDAEAYDRVLADETRSETRQSEEEPEGAVAQWRRQAELSEDESADPIASAIKNDLENHGVEVNNEKHNPADLPASARGSRRIVGAKCHKCGANLPDLPTDKTDVWLWVNCPACKEFNSASDAAKHGGRVIGQ